ncbi:MAG: recombinase, partial [Psychroflexus sp.]
MTIKLKKIHHRGQYRIGIYFKYKFYNKSVRQKLYKINAKFSKTKRCWYCDYSKTCFRYLKSNFEDLKVVTTSEDSDTTKVAENKSRETLPIAQN